MAFSIQPRARIIFRRTNFPKLLSLVVFAICSCVILGWLTGAEVLRSFFPNLPQMIPMTALTTMLLTASLFTLSRYNGRETQMIPARALLVSRSLSLVVILLAAEAMLEHIFGIEGGIHRLLEMDMFGVERALYSGRMSPQTSISACLLATSALLFSYGLEVRRRVFFQLFVCLTISISILALVGYMYRITPFYGLSRFLGLSIPTALSFLMLSIASLGLDRREGFVAALLQRNSGGLFFRRFAMVSVLLPLITALTIRSGELWGLYPSSFSMAVFVVVTIFSLFFLAYKTAESIADSEKQALSLERNQVASAEAEIRHEAVEEIRSRMIHALQASQMGYWEWDFATNQVNWSEIQNKIFGLSLGTRIRHVSDILGVVHPQDVELVKHKINYAIKTRTELDIEFRVMVHNGEVRWINCRGRAQYNGQGRGFCMHGTNFDTTERRVAVNQITEQARLLEVTHDAVIVRDRENQVTFWNRGAQQLYGYSTAEALGFNANHLLATKFPSGNEPEPAELKQRGYWEGELQHRTKDGRWISVMSRWTLTDKLQENFRLLETNTDITGLKETERELVKAKEQAEAANELKSSFLANMSHEIRTPLGAILGFVELVSDPTEDEKNKFEYLKIIRRNGAQLSNLINDILDLSKVESGQFKVEIYASSLKNIIEEVLASLSVNANDKNLQLRATIDPSMPDEICTDSSRLKQILLNIVGNAVKFTYDGSIDIEVYPGPEQEVIFVVSDTGIGINEEQAKLLFQPFSQGDPGITRKFGGTGLGLVLSRELARALGGDLMLKDSELGQGSRFEIRIENHILLPNEAKAIMSDRATNPLPHNEDALKDLRILLVEDSPDNQDLISYMLNKRGAKVDIAENGMVGVQKAFSGQYDLVLMDIQMPIMDGYTAIQKLRLEGFKKPIIALTAHAMTEVRRKCLEVGFNDYLTKPIHIDELVKSVSQAAQKP